MRNLFSYLVCLRVCGVIGSLDDVLCIDVISVVPVNKKIIVKNKLSFKKIEGYCD